MSEKRTSVEVSGVQGAGAGLTLPGHLSLDDALLEYRQHLDREMALIRASLDALANGSVQVFHQRGIWRITDRREVTS